jgi:uncharacterized protein (DUF2384 family)
MKKLSKDNKKKIGKSAAPSKKTEEPVTVYGRTSRAMPGLKDFTFPEFKKIADKAPFTQTEWASILHLSERTLQRYAKNEGVFAPMNAERVMQIAKLLEQGKATFGKVENFYNWLKREPYMMEGNLSMQDLSTYDGIQRISTQLSRIQHGLFA